MGLRISSLWLITSALVLACGDSPFSPTVDNVSGDYHASVLRATQAGLTSDFLANGGSLDVTLESNGTTSGRLFLPNGSDTGGDLDVDLTGTWTLNGKIVTFIQEGDTFIRDVPFTAARNSLSAESTFNAGTTSEFTIRAVLVK
jgi:hypothetical protein